MNERTSDRGERERRRLTPATMSAEQRAAYERRKAARDTPESRESLARDLEAIQKEFPPRAPDPIVTEFLASLRVERERQGLSLSDLEERTGIKAANLSRLETGKQVNPTVTTLRTLAAGLGKRLVLTFEDAVD